jgi:hypothetical protein
LNTQGVFALLASLVGIPFACWYAFLAAKKKTEPPFSTWLIFTATVTISFASYVASGKRDILSAISNTTDLFIVWATLIAILVGQRLTALRFTKVEIFCGIGIAKICIAWALTAHFFGREIGGLAAYWSIQGVMILAYWPTISRLAKSKTATEPFKPWLGTLCSMSFGLGSALVGGNYLAALYPARAIVMISVVLLIFAFKQKKAR